MTLIFVYNADSGLFNALSDTAHKMLSPETYECNLCAITYSALGMKKEWRDFLKQLGISTEFLHRNELDRKYAIHGTDLPAVFSMKTGNMKLLISAQEINACRSIEELKELVMTKVQSVS